VANTRSTWPRLQVSRLLLRSLQPLRLRLLIYFRELFQFSYDLSQILIFVFFLVSARQATLSFNKVSSSRPPSLVGGIKVVTNRRSGAKTSSPDDDLSNKVCLSSGLSYSEMAQFSHLLSKMHVDDEDDGTESPPSPPVKRRVLKRVRVKEEDVAFKDVVDSISGKSSMSLIVSFLFLM
jgi:hypothetical protein